MRLPFLSIDVGNIANISFTPNYNAPLDDIAAPNNQNSTSSNNTTNRGDTEDPPSGLSKGAIGGIIAGAIVVVRDVSYGQY